MPGSGSSGYPDSASPLPAQRRTGRRSLSDDAIANAIRKRSPVRKNRPGNLRAASARQSLLCRYRMTSLVGNQQQIPETVNNQFILFYALLMHLFISKILSMFTKLIKFPFKSISFPFSRAPSFSTGASAHLLPGTPPESAGPFPEKRNRPQSPTHEEGPAADGIP